MDHRFSPAYTRAFTQARYARYAADLRNRVGAPILFRLAETPVFLDASFRERCERATREIVAQLSDPIRLRVFERAIPDRWWTPGLRGLPNFAMLDFAIVFARDGTPVPRLIELQGFPSLLAFTLLQRDAWVAALADVPELDRAWSCWYSGLDRDAFLALATRTLLGSKDPTNVILMDIEPEAQKTNADFSATKVLWGVDSVTPMALIKRRHKLFRRGPEDKEIPVERIYNRVVFDELERKQLALPFDYRDDLEVEWAPHPNWFWMWSKYALPLLDHPCVPSARYLSDYDTLPHNLTTGYVLKPLFSFSGGGVNLSPTPADIARIPSDERNNWLLQEKVEYAPLIEAHDGGRVKVELRVMLLRPDDATTPIAAENLCRLARGDMMGVEYNQDASWVGSSVALWL